MINVIGAMSTSRSQGSRAMKELLVGMDKSSGTVSYTSAVGNNDGLQAELDGLIGHGLAAGADNGGPSSQSDHWKSVQRPLNNHAGPWHGISSYKREQDTRYDGARAQPKKAESLHVERSKSR